MSKTQKIVLGILTFLPIIIIPFFIIRIISFALHVSALHDEPDPGWVLTQIATFAGPLIAVAILRLALMVYYIVHAINNQTIQSTERVIWILLFLFMGTISCIIYWILRVWDSGLMPPGKKAGATA